MTTIVRTEAIEDSLAAWRRLPPKNSTSLAASPDIFSITACVIFQNYNWSVQNTQ